MAKFNVGQRVKHTYSLLGRVPAGAIGVVVRGPFVNGADGDATRCVRYEVEFQSFPGVWWPRETQLSALGDEQPFKDFMDRVLKPVDLGKPVKA
jgi:hypothetical protein